MTTRINTTVMVILAALLLSPDQARAASSNGCVGGGFSVLGVSGNRTAIVPAAQVGGSFLVKGRYVEFTVDADTFGVRDWTLTGVANELDLTGGRRTIVFAAKIPNHQGLTLTSDVQVSLDAESIELTRSGSGLSMKLQANDCATGGIFQMEPARADARPTVFTHVLGNEVFYFDNPNFRTHLNEQFPCVGCNGAVNDLVTVTARVNFGNDFSRNFVGRDSPQAATRITPAGCPNTIPNAKNPGTVDHCGGESQWSVQSGGRMGQVMGEDATEVAPAAKTCTQNCQAQDRIRGRATVLGFPFPVPDPVRLKPRFPAGFVVP